MGPIQQDILERDIRRLYAAGYDERQIVREINYGATQKIFRITVRDVFRILRNEV